MTFFLCGFFFNDVTVLVDTQENRVYEYASADVMQADFVKDYDAAKKKYENGYYVITAKAGMAAKGDGAVIAGTRPAKGERIIFSCPENLREEALKYKADENIGIYGKISFRFFDKEVYFEAEKLFSVKGAIKNGTYFLLDGSTIDKNSMSKRTLDGGRVSFLIPASWKETEHSIAKEGIGTIEGYQYVLNQLPDNMDTVPESFFVCYFDNASRLENADDKKETALIEKAIINNISGEGRADTARHKEVRTYYGARYDYYISSYTDALDTGAKGYHAEYIFQRDGDRGLIMYLYVYKNAKHLSDVMFVTRFLGAGA